MRMLQRLKGLNSRVQKEEKKDVTRKLMAVTQHFEMGVIPEPRNSSAQ